MNYRINDLTGQRFGRLIVVGDDGERDKRGTVMWVCKCDCGNTTKVRGFNLTTKRNKITKKGSPTVSCGCRLKEINAELGAKSITHGQRGDIILPRSPAYTTWYNMKQRCYNPNATSYNRYGGRGIIICDEWKDSFEAFFDDMGPRDSHQSIDRINNDGNYEPRNCQWVSKSQNSRKGSGRRLRQEVI